MNDSNCDAPSDEGKKEKWNKRSELQEESDDERSKGELTDSQQQDPPTDVIPYTGTEITRTEGTPAVGCENDISHLPHHPRWWLWGIRKDDEFFHFVILCFAVGMLLVCYYKFDSWTVSLGIGLISFAVLETTGIYFGLVYRIRTTLESFLTLLQKVKIPGFKKLN